MQGGEGDGDEEAEEGGEADDGATLEIGFRHHRFGDHRQHRPGPGPARTAICFAFLSGRQQPANPLRLTLFRFRVRLVMYCVFSKPCVRAPAASAPLDDAPASPSGCFLAGASFQLVENTQYITSWTLTLEPAEPVVVA